MKDYCDICRGEGLIRLPVHRRVSVCDLSAALPSIVEADSRSYPCPQCAQTIPQERLAVVEYHSLVDTRFNDPEFLAYAKQRAAHNLVGALLKGGFVGFDRAPHIVHELHYQMRATVGVASPQHVAAFEQRVAEHQERLAREVIVEAGHEIRNWGSCYHGNDGSINKLHAIDCLDDALRTVLARRASIKAVA